MNLIKEDNNQSLPPELDWSNMKSGIFDKMESIEKGSSFHRKNKYPWKRIGLLLLLFLVLTLGLFSAYQYFTKNTGAEAETIVELTDTDTHNNASNSKSKRSTSNQITAADKPFTENMLSAKEDDLPLNRKKAKRNDNLMTSEVPLLDNDPILEDQYLNEASSQNTMLNKDRMVVTQSPINTTHNTSTPLTETTLSISMLQASETLALPLYSFDQIISETANDSSLDIPKFEHASRSNERRGKSPNQFVLEGGLTFWNQGYGNSMPESAPYETTLTSFQLQGHYLINFNNNYFVMAGLQYQQLESRFEYNSTIPDYKVTIKDTIVQVQNNPITGEQNVIYGDVEQTVLAERRVRHYNQTKLLKVSLAGGKSWRFDSFQFDVYFGGALNTLVQNQGRSLFNNTVIDFNNDSNPLFQNQMTVDGILGGRVHYFFNQNIGITAGFQTQKSIMNWSVQDDINFYPATISLQLGMSYSLN